MLTTILALAGAVQAVSDTDIMAQSKAGHLLCANPEPTLKTCSSLTSFKAGADGRLVETTETLLSPARPITLTMSINAEVKGATNCGMMTAKDLATAKLRMSGQALPTAQAAAMMRQVEAGLRPLLGKRVCDELRGGSGGLSKHGRVEGMAVTPAPKPVQWVSATDGYRVRPR